MYILEKWKNPWKLWDQTINYDGTRRRLEPSCLPLDDHRDLHDSFLELGASILAKRQAPYLALTYLLWSCRIYIILQILVDNSWLSHICWIVCWINRFETTIFAINPGPPRTHCASRVTSLAPMVAAVTAATTWTAAMVTLRSGEKGRVKPGVFTSRWVGCGPCGDELNPPQQIPCIYHHILPMNTHFMDMTQLVYSLYSWDVILIPQNSRGKRIKRSWLICQYNTHIYKLTADRKTILSQWLHWEKQNSQTEQSKSVSSEGNKVRRHVARCCQWLSETKDMKKWSKSKVASDFSQPTNFHQWNSAPYPPWKRQFVQIHGISSMK